jgi:hypothetical protein
MHNQGTYCSAQLVLFICTGLFNQLSHARTISDFGERRESGRMLFHYCLLTHVEIMSYARQELEWLRRSLHALPNYASTHASERAAFERAFLSMVLRDYFVWHRQSSVVRTGVLTVFWTLQRVRTHTRAHTASHVIYSTANYMPTS